MKNYTLFSLTLVGAIAITATTHSMNLKKNSATTLTLFMSNLQKELSLSTNTINNFNTGCLRDAVATLNTISTCKESTPDSDHLLGQTMHLLNKAQQDVNSLHKNTVISGPKDADNISHCDKSKILARVAITSYIIKNLQEDEKYKNLRATKISLNINNKKTELTMSSFLVLFDKELNEKTLNALKAQGSLTKIYLSDGIEKAFSTDKSL